MPKFNKNLSCNTKLKVTNGTIFFKHRLSIQKILFLLYEFSVGTPINKVAFEYECSEHTAGDWYRKFREIIAYHISESEIKIG